MASGKSSVRSAFVYGGSVFGRALAAELKDHDWRIAGFLDDNPLLLGEISGICMVGGVGTLRFSERVPVGAQVFIAIGATADRERVSGRLKIERDDLVFPNFVHRKANVSSGSLLGQGCLILPGASLAPGCMLGDFVVVGANASIGAEVKIGSHVSVCPGVNLGSKTEIGEKSYLGMGATILQCLKIGSSVTVGAQSLVKNSINSGAVVAGVPAVQL